MLAKLLVTSNAEERRARYEQVWEAVAALLGDDSDWIAAMATTACELHHAFEYFHWTGFYRATKSDELVIGPYQGGHGCIHIAFSRGVCGAAARTRATQLVPDVHAFPDHIACASSTRSELVVPVVTPSGRLLAVLDVDSDHPAAFTEADARGLETICAALGRRYADTSVL